MNLKDVDDSRDFEEMNSPHEIQHSEREFSDSLTRSLLLSEIRTAMKQLSEIERKLIDLLFFDGYNKINVRKILKLNTEEFSTLYTNVLEKMKGLL